jgi:prepilin-type N-terminal cleavage/methylation domain-containing protein
MKKNKGFSLIELMISITIVGIIATIVLSNLSNSRARAYDSKVIQQLRSFRTAADIYFGSQSPTGYGPATAGCGSGIFNDFSKSNGTPGIYIAAGNLPSGTQTACQSNDGAYAVKATLYSGSEYWCVDNKGAFRKIDTPIDGPSLFCP